MPQSFKFFGVCFDRIDDNSRYLILQKFQSPVLFKTGGGHFHSAQVRLVNVWVKNSIVLKFRSIPNAVYEVLVRDSESEFIGLLYENQLIDHPFENNFLQIHLFNEIRWHRTSETGPHEFYLVFIQDVELVVSNYGAVHFCGEVLIDITRTAPPKKEDEDHYDSEKRYFNDPRTGVTPHQVEQRKFLLTFYG